MTDLLHCTQDGCCRWATHCFRWPGKERYQPACAQHTAKAVQVAHVLGFVLGVSDADMLLAEDAVARLKTLGEGA